MDIDPQPTRSRAFCAYCGGRQEQRDHVIPRQMYPADGKFRVTVESCLQCGAAKKRFDDFMSHTVATDIRTANHPIAKEQFEGPVLRAIQGRHSEVARRVASARNPILGVTPEGVLVPLEQIPADDMISGWLAYVGKGLVKFHYPANRSADGLTIRVAELSEIDLAVGERLVSEMPGTIGPNALGDAHAPYPPIFRWIGNVASESNWLWFVSLYGGLHYKIFALPELATEATPETA